MKVLINYADNKYASAQWWNSFTGRHIAKFDTIYSFGPKDIEESYKSTYKDIFSFNRGNGLWLWKPYFIQKVINKMEYGDILFYCDSGALFIRNPKEIINQLSNENPLFVCDIPLIESCWTKPLCFMAMQCDTEEFKTSNQIIGTYFAIYVNDFTRGFVSEWLSYCEQYDLICPEGLAKGMACNHNYGMTFVSHREDQSIFSLLCKKHQIKPHKDISQRGNHPESYKSDYYAFNVPFHENDTYKPFVFLHKQPSFLIFMMKNVYRFMHFHKN